MQIQLCDVTRSTISWYYTIALQWQQQNINQDFNSLLPGKFERNFRHVIFKQILVIDDWGISCGIALTWKPQDLADDKSTLVQAMAWCRQASSHYLSQGWPSSLSPYGVTRPQWVKLTRYPIFIRHPISHPYRWAMGVLWGIWRKLTVLYYEALVLTA